MQTRIGLVVRVPQRKKKQIAIRLKQIAKRFNKQTLPALGWVQRRRLIEETRIVDKVLGRMMSSDNN